MEKHVEHHTEAGELKIKLFSRTVESAAQINNILASMPMVGEAQWGKEPLWSQAPQLRTETIRL